MRTRDRAPPLPRPCIALPRAAPRRAARGRQERGKKEKRNATGNEREMFMLRACARTLSPRTFLVPGQRLQRTPSPLCGLASWPLLGACSMYPEEQFLTWLLSAPASPWAPPPDLGHALADTRLAHRAPVALNAAPGLERDRVDARRLPSGAVWSFVLPNHALEAPFRSLRAPKLARNKGASVGGDLAA